MEISNKRGEISICRLSIYPPRVQGKLKGTYSPATPISLTKRLSCYLLIAASNVLIISCLALSENYVILCSNLKAPFLLNSEIKPKLNFDIEKHTLDIGLE